MAFATSQIHDPLASNVPRKTGTDWGSCDRLAMKTAEASKHSFMCCHSEGDDCTAYLRSSHCNACSRKGKVGNG